MDHVAHWSLSSLESFTEIIGVYIFWGECANKQEMVSDSQICIQNTWKYIKDTSLFHARKKRASLLKMLKKYHLVKMLVWGIIWHFLFFSRLSFSISANIHIFNWESDEMIKGGLMATEMWLTTLCNEGKPIIMELPNATYFGGLGKIYGIWGITWLHFLSLVGKKKVLKWIFFVGIWSTILDSNQIPTLEPEHW